jgi:hypothetical protein
MSPTLGDAMNRTVALIAWIGMCGAAALSFCNMPGLQSAGHATPAPDRPSVWVEAKWPFPMDQWGEGKAFECKAADCGAEINLYIRAKIGFCSRTRGVADDDELDRLSDFDLMDGRAAALARSHEIEIAGMKGRIRAYAVTSLIRPRTYAFSIAFNNNDDAVVATALFDGAQLAAAELIVIQFLSGKIVQRWVTVTLGL